jgi:hypothetical protein
MSTILPLVGSSIFTFFSRDEDTRDGVATLWIAVRGWEALKVFTRGALLRVVIDGRPKFFWCGHESFYFLLARRIAISKGTKKSFARDKNTGRKYIYIFVAAPRKILPTGRFEVRVSKKNFLAP